MNLKDGIGMFDISKGMIMISVIVYHTLAFAMDDKTVIPQLAGLMLAMFFIYGYAMKPVPAKESVKSRFKMLIVPYMYFAAFHIIIRLAVSLPRIISGKLSLYGWFRYNALPMILAFNSECNPEFLGNGSLWFVLALAIAAVILNEILKISDWKLQTAAVCMVVLLGYILGNVSMHCFGISFNLFVAMMMTGYMYVGYWFKQKQLFYCSWSMGIYILAACIFVFAFFFDDSIIAGSIWEYGMASYLMLGIVSVCFLKAVIMLNAFENKYLDMIADVGYYSMSVYLAHSFELENISWTGLTSRIGIANPAAGLIQMICRVLFIYAAVKLYNDISRKIKRARRKKAKRNQK